MDSLPIHQFFPSVVTLVRVTTRDASILKIKNHETRRNTFFERNFSPSVRCVRASICSECSQSLAPQNKLTLNASWKQSGFFPAASLVYLLTFSFRPSFPFALNRLPERLDNGRDNTRDTASVIAGDDSFSTLSRWPIAASR